jgi:outer membrane protein
VAARARFARPLVAAAFAALLAPSAQALDLVEVWRAAAAHDAEFAAARAARGAGEARRRQGVALWRPTVALEGDAALARRETSVRGARFSAPGFGTSNDVAFDTSVSAGASGRVALTLRQPLIGRERDAEAAQLAIAGDAAELAWRAAGQALMLRSAERYFDVALAGEQLRLIVQQQAAVDQALVEARDRFRIGDRPVTDTHEAAARAASLKAQRLAAATQLEVRRVALADLAGLAVDTGSLALPRGVPPVDELGDVAGWLGQADRDNPTVLLAQARVRNAEAEARKSAGAWSPTLDLVAQVARERLSGSGDYGNASNAGADSAIGVRLNVPLYTGGMRSARQLEAERLLEQARAELEQARRQVARDTREAWLDLAVGREQIRALEAAAEASDARFDATRVGVQAGDRTTLDLLNAQNDAAAARHAVLQAQARLLTGRLRLAALAGQLDDTALARVNAFLQGH